MGLMKDSKTLELELSTTVDKIFSTIVEVGKEIGRIKTESKSMGHIIIKCPMKLFPPINPATLDVIITKKNEDTTNLKISCNSNYDGIIGLSSASRWQEKLIDGIEKRL